MPNNNPIAVLKHRGTYEQVFAPGVLGYTLIPGGGKTPIFAFINTSRTPSGYVNDVAFHELGHTLLQARGFYSTVIPDGHIHAQLMSLAQNLVQDLAIEQELAARGASDQMQLRHLLNQLLDGVASGQEIRAMRILPSPVRHQRLAARSTWLLLGVRGEDDTKNRLRTLLTGEARSQVRRFERLLEAGCCKDDGTYRQKVTQIALWMGVPQAHIVFAPD